MLLLLLLQAYCYQRCCCHKSFAMFCTFPPTRQSNRGSYVAFVWNYVCMYDAAEWNCVERRPAGTKAPTEQTKLRAAEHGWQRSGANAIQMQCVIAKMCVCVYVYRCVWHVRVGRCLSLWLLYVIIAKKKRRKRSTLLLSKRVLHATACCICGIFNNGKCM